MFYHLHPRSITSPLLPVLSIATLMVTSSSIYAQSHYHFNPFEAWNERKQNADQALRKIMKTVQSHEFSIKSGVPYSSRRSLLADWEPRRPAGVPTHSLNYEYKTGGYDFPAFPFAGGSARFSMGQTKWWLTAEGWHTKGWKKFSYVGRGGASLELKAAIDWGIIKRERELFHIPMITGYCSYFYTFSAGPYVEAKPTVGFVGNARYIDDGATRHFNCGGGIPLSVAIKIGIGAEASVKFKKFFYNPTQRKYISAQEGVVVKIKGSLDGTANATSGMHFGYVRNINHSKNGKSNSIWAQFDGFQCIVGGEASAEYGSHKVVARVTHRAWATNSWRATRQWAGGEPN